MGGHESREKSGSGKKSKASLEQRKNQIEKEFDCTIEVIPAETSSNPKAKNAFPLKPAILIE